MKFINQKEFFLILIICGFFVIIGGIWYWQSQKIEISLTRNETANWKTYRNEQYGFEIKYPITWKICDLNNDSYIDLHIFLRKSDLKCTPLPGAEARPPETIDGKPNPYIWSVIYDISIAKIDNLEINKYNINNNVKCNNYKDCVNQIKNYKSSPIEDIQINNIKEFKINNKNQSLCYDFSSVVGYSGTVILLFREDNKIGAYVSLGSTASCKNLTNNANMNEIYKIISTFKFVR